MQKLALTLPGTNTTINDPVKTGPGEAITNNTLGGVLSGGFNIVLLVVGFLLLYWLTWGIFQYLFSGGNKENLAKARTRITWALIGFVVVILAYSVSRYVQTIFPTNFSKVTNITVPTN